jgi:hypothetical protein
MFTVNFLFYARIWYLVRLSSTAIETFLDIPHLIQRPHVTVRSIIH